MNNDLGIGLMGVEIGSSDDPVLMMSAVLNQPQVVGYFDKDRREDFELWSALHALGYYGAARPRLGVSIPDDPNVRPDRRLVAGDREWGTELTQLTINEINPSTPPTPRQLVAQANDFRTRLQQRIESDAASYVHLVGRAVMLQRPFGARELPKKDGKLLEEIAEALKQDKGVMFTPHGSLAPNGQGDYGSYGPLSVTVQTIPGITEFGIYMAYDFAVSRSEALDAFAKRIAEKDKPGNEIVIVTCGVPDRHGWSTGSDQAIYQHLLAANRSGTVLVPKTPTHIRGILIHESPSAPGLILLNDHDDVPWQTSPGSTVPVGPASGPRFRPPAPPQP